jgi:hypothetical protein
MLGLASALAYLGGAVLIVALVVGYVRALRQGPSATARHKLLAGIGAVMLVLLVASLVLGPRGSTALFAAAAAVMVATNLDLLRRQNRTSSGSQGVDAR